ncbi:hypothetical protein Hte_009816 [Hypoxylon texense]
MPASRMSKNQGSLPQRKFHQPPTCSCPRWETINFDDLKLQRTPTFNNEGRYICEYTGPNKPCVVEGVRPTFNTRIQWDTHMDRHDSRWICQHTCKTHKCPGNKSLSTEHTFNRHYAECHHEGKYMNNLFCGWLLCLAEREGEPFARASNKNDHIIRCHTLEREELERAARKDFQENFNEPLPDWLSPLTGDSPPEEDENDESQQNPQAGQKRKATTSNAPKNHPKRAATENRRLQADNEAIQAHNEALLAENKKLHDDVLERDRVIAELRERLQACSCGAPGSKTASDSGVETGHANDSGI